MVFGFDVDAVALKEVECVFCESFVEHRKDLGGDVVDCDFDVGDKCGIESAEVLVAKVEQLGCELDAGS